MVARAKYGLDLIVDRQKELCLAGRFKAGHDLFSAPRRSMRAFGPVVLALMPAVVDAGREAFQSRTIAAELVRDHNPRLPVLLE